MQPFLEHNKCLEQLFSLFEDSYRRIYRTIQSPSKASIISFAGITYKKWYYSTLVNGTFFSPANIFCSQVRTRSETHIPVIRPDYSGKNIEFDFEVVKFSSNNHPIVDDLKIVVDAFFPASPTNENGYLSDEKTNDLMNKVTFFDPFYIMYLTEIAFKLNLLNHLKSIHSFIVQPTQYCQDFFSDTKKNQLDKMVAVAIEISAERLSLILPIGTQIFNPAFIKSLLITPLSTDEIFEYIFKSLNVDILSIIESRTKDENGENSTAGDPLNEFDEMLLSSTFVIGLAIDQWFLTPFGHYFQFIQPIYYFPYNMKNEMYFLLDDINANAELFSSIFTPCTTYNITNIGAKLFGAASTDSSFPHVKRNRTLQRFLNEIFLEMKYEEATSLYNYYTKGLKNKIYELKVKIQSDKRCWKIIEIEEGVTLHDLHNVIAFAFSYSPIEDYSFFTSDEPSPFFEYASPWNEKRTKKATDIKVLDAFKEKKVLYICKDIFSVEVELLKVKLPVFDVSYPRLVRKSKWMDLYEKG